MDESLSRYAIEHFLGSIAYLGFKAEEGILKKENRSGRISHNRPESTKTKFFNYNCSFEECIILGSLCNRHANKYNKLINSGVQ